MSNPRENEILENLTGMGYSAPDWDNYHIHKAPPPTLTIPNVQPIEMTKKQLFIIKAWPKIEGFFQEDEDPIVIGNAETVQKNGQIARIFRLGFDNELGHRWQFVLEKRIDAGLDDIHEADIRQIWAKSAKFDDIPSIEEKFLYTRSFDTQASSSKFKSNTEDGVVTSVQKSFLKEVKNSLVEAYQNSDSFSRQEESGEEFFKGKEFQFEEKGNHITWTVSIRQLDNSEFPANTWFVNSALTETSTPPCEEEKGMISPNPFENYTENEEKSEVEQQEIDRQIVEQKMMEFIGNVWPKIRKFYLELSDDDTEFATTVARKNGYPTRMLELHFDTLNERNRWKFLFEISVASNEIPSRPWAQLDPSTTDKYFESRTYGSYEKRGTSSRHWEDKNDYFTGFYKRWFLTDLQLKLVKCFAQVGYFVVNPATFDSYLYKFGKDLEFCDSQSHPGDQVTWSFSIQQLAKYPELEVPSNVWCYGISDNFITPEIDADGVHSDGSDATDGSEIDFDVSSKIVREPTKSKSKIRTLARNIVKPVAVMRKKSWFTGTSAIFRNKKRVKDGKSQESHVKKEATTEDKKDVDLTTSILVEPREV